MFKHAMQRLVVAVLIMGMVVPPGGSARELAGEIGTLPSSSGLYRTRVAVRQPADWARLERVGVTVLEQGEDWALVLVDEDQLETLARLRFEPQGTDELGMLVTAHAQAKPWLAASWAEVQRSRGAGETASPQLLRSLAPELKAGLSSLSSVDDDADGLTNTQEQWWCTDPLNPDSDGDGTNDGDEVQAAKDWLGNLRGSYPSTGKPFVGWPPDHTGCYDDDQDSIPDLAERWELGLNMNRESTDRDKFDDGQELFGNTKCPGYGALPRAVDEGIIFCEMPSWVKVPGDHPLVAAFPVPEIDVVESSLHVETVTVVTTDHTIGEGTERSYSTAKTEGTSTSVANTETWNEWQEVSESLEQMLPPAASWLGKGNVTSSEATGVDWSQFATGALTIGGGLLAGAAGCVGGIATAGVTCILGLGAAATGIASGAIDVIDSLSADEEQERQNVNVYNTTDVRLENQTDVNNEIQVMLNQSFDTDSIVKAIDGTRYAYLKTGEVLDQRLYQMTQVLAAPRQTTTQSQGRSVGGAQTHTHEEYEEHTITNGEAFSGQESWGTATAVDSSHAAELWFTYQVRNTGTEYAREIADLAFNIYIGDDPNPAYTYFVGPDLGGDGKFHNFMPGDEHTYTSRRIPLTLNQMAAVDLGGPVRIVVEDFTYGIDELFYEDAVNSGVLIAIEDGKDDGDELIDTYLIPTWGEETVLDVLARYFPHTADADGNLIAIWTPEQRADTPSWCNEPNRVGTTLWCKHALSTADWWNIYTDGLGDGSEGFQDTPAAPGSVALFRFNKDSDLDGYSDRSEIRLGTDPNDPADYPKPELIAGVHSTRTGDDVVATLSLLNTGFYDAYGVEAVMIAPDDSVSITNNTVGGSGRVRALKQVIVGSRILPPAYDDATWQGTAQPFSSGYYTGNVDRTYTFTAVDSGDVFTDTLVFNWTDGIGTTGTLSFPSGYPSPTPLDVGDYGVKLGLLSGSVNADDTFTVEARTPRDTFQYTINREPYTEPVVIVSYNDPQGNHRFVTPVHLSTPTENLAPHSGKMLHGDADVEIVTQAPFDPEQANTTTLIAQAPVATRLVDAHLFLEFIDPEGTVVREEATTVTLETGPNVVDIPWNPADFNPAYDPEQDYIVMAFFTDWQGNILDTAARPLSSFQEDPKPVFALDETGTTWDFGTVPQGTLLEHTFTLANTGMMNLKATVVGTGVRTDQNVPGNPAWTDTGLDVAAGDAIGIRASGTACFNGADPNSCYDPDGSGDPAPANYALPGASSGSLIAKIDDEAPFFIGSAYVNTASNSGRLYLGTNDCDGCYGNNSGAYQAHIEIQGVPTSFQESPSFSVSPADATNLDVTLDTYYLPTGSFNRSILVRTSDPAYPTQTFQIQGAIDPYVVPAQSMAVSPYRPWDQRVAVSGDREHREVVTFDDTIAADATDVQPLRVYNDTRQTVLGVGKEIARAAASGELAASSADETASLNTTSTDSVFGDGSDGDLTVSSGQTVYVDDVRRPLASTASVGQGALYVGTVAGFQMGGEVLVIQVQGTGAGNYEFGIIVGINGGLATLTLQDNLQHSYTVGGSSKAQVLQVPHYRNVTVQSGGTLTAHAWDGSTGGILVFRANGAVAVDGTVTASGGDGSNVTGHCVSTGGGGTGGGFRGGNAFRQHWDVSECGWSDDFNPGYQGAGTASPGIRSRYPNGNGGGGGRGGEGGIQYSGAGGGGGNGTPGGDGQNEPGYGGQAAGAADLSVMVFGGGGGGGQKVYSYQAGGGGSGGGIIAIFANNLTVSGTVQARGGRGGDSGSYDKAGGGGAGGSILIKAQSANVGANRVDASGGIGGSAGEGSGGDGGVGRIRIEYCDTFSGSTNPSASVAKINFCYGTVSGKVFSDDNGNGVQDAGEPGLAGVTVSLSGVGQTTTGGDGGYSFTANAPANYTVSVTPPAGHDCTTPCSVNISLQVDQTTTVNFALRPRASIAGKVFHDTNNSGVQDAGESGVGGVTVTLDDTGQTRTTAGDGSYSFADLTPGSYSVSITVPDGYVNTTSTTVSCSLAAGSVCTASFGILKYTIEKVSGSEHQIRLFMPESFRGGRRYWVQYGRKMVFNAAGQQQAQVKLPKAHYGTVTMDVLLAEPVSANTFVQLNLDVGCDGSSEWSKNANLAIPTTLSTNDLALGLNRFMAGATPGADGLVTVPLCLSFSIAGRLYLTNLVATPDGTSDVSIGPADVTLNPTNPVEGDTVNVQATLHNASGYDSGGLIASFYATAPDWGETYIGSAFVANVPAGGSAQASIPWNTLGFTGNVPVRVKADPYDRVAETNEDNNEATASLTILTRPDLHVTAIELSDPEPVAGQPVTVTLTISNAGQTDAGTSALALYDSNPESGGTLLGEDTSAVGGESQTTLDFTWTPTEPGLYRLFTVSDRDDAVNEFDEGNNQSWEDVYVGFAGPLLLNSGTPGDVQYNAEQGYGYVDEGQADILGNCGTEPYQTYRLDADGRVVYHFDHLLPGHFYHLDVTLYECGQGAGRQEVVKVDDITVGGPEDLGDGEEHRLSILLDPALYADRTISVTVEAYEGLGALVNEIALHDVDYRYADSGPVNDPQYPTGDLPYGWLDGSSTSASGSLPYQTARVDLLDNDVQYQFDELDPLKRYQVHLSFYQSSGNNRVQQVWIDGQPTGTELTIVSGQRYSTTVSAPLTAYQGDGSIVVSAVRTNASVGAMINEIALEEETQIDAATCPDLATPYWTIAYNNVTIAGQPAPPGTVVTAESPRGDVVGCFIVKQDTPGLYGFMPIYGEDPTAIPPIPGMRDGELVTFRVNGALAVPSPPLEWHDDKTPHPVDLEAGVTEAQSILLDPNWNLISFRVEPPTPLVNQVLNSIEGRYDRVLGETGVYVPDLPDVYNTLKELHCGEGYYLRLTGVTSVNLLVEGLPCAADTPIPLHQGWNWIGYLPEETLPTTQALQSIEGHYQRVLSLDKVYDPALPEFSTLQEMSSGEGYLIYASDPVTLTYPAGGGGGGLGVQPSTRETACADVVPTPYLTLVYGHIAVNGQPAPAGTRVDVLTPRGEIAGCFAVEQAGQYGLMHVYGADDTAEPPIPGFRESESLDFRVNGITANASVALSWQDDKAPHEVDLDVTIRSVYLPLILKSH